MTSTLMIWTVATESAHVVLETDRLIEAPNWDPSGASLLVNGDGHLFLVPLEDVRRWYRYHLRSRGDRHFVE